MDDTGVLRNASGQPLDLTVLLKQDGLIQQATAMMDIYARALERLGITLTVQSIDKAQYDAREDEYDFDLAFLRRSISLSPGNDKVITGAPRPPINPAGAT